MGKRIKLPCYACVVLFLPALCYCKDISVLCQDNGDMLILDQVNVADLENCLNGTELQCKNLNNQSTLEIADQSSYTNSIADQTSYTNSIADQTSYTHSIADQSSYTSSIADQTSYSNSIADQTSYTNSIADQSSYTSSIADQSSYTNSIADQTSYTSSTADQTSYNSSTADQTSYISSTAVQSSYTSSTADQSSYTSSIADQTSYTSSIADQSSYTSFIADQPSHISFIVDQSSYTISIADQTSYTSSTADQSSYTSSTTDQSSYTSFIVDQPSHISFIVDQSSYTKSIAYQTSYTSSTADQSSFNSSTADQSSYTSFTADQSLYTSFTPDQSTYFNSIADQHIYTTSIIDATYSPTALISTSIVADIASTGGFFGNASLKTINSSGMLLSDAIDSVLATGQDPNTAATRSYVSLILGSASEITSGPLSQSEITKAIELSEMFTRTTLHSSNDDFRTSLLHAESSFESTPVLYDSFSTNLYSTVESTFMVQQSMNTLVTFESRSSVTLHTSLDYTLTTSHTNELDNTSILKHETEMATGSISGSFVLSLAQTLAQTSDESTRVFTEMTQNNPSFLSRFSELFAESSSVSATSLFEIIGSRSPISFDSDSEIYYTSNHQVTSTIPLVYPTMTTSMFETTNTFSSSNAMTPQPDVPTAGWANVTGDATETTTGHHVWDNSTAPAIAETGSAGQLVPTVVGVVLGTVAVVALVVLLCLYVRHKKRTQLKTRAQRYKTNGYRSWKNLKRNEAEEKKESFVNEVQHYTLSELVTTGKSKNTFIRNSFDSFNGFDSPGENLTIDRVQTQTSNVDVPYEDKTISSTSRQEKTVPKALNGGVDNRLDVGTIISGLNNNIQHKNNHKARKSHVFNLEETNRNDQGLTGPDTQIARRLLTKDEELKHKAELRMASAKYSIYSEIKSEDMNTDSVAVRPISSGVYTTIDETNAKHIISRIDSLYDQVEETGNFPKENYYSSVRKESRDPNGRMFPSVSSLYGTSRISDSSLSGISQRADSTRNSHMYEYVSFTCGNDLKEIVHCKPNSLYSTLGPDLREPLNYYNSLPILDESAGPGEAPSEHKPLPKTLPNVQIPGIHEAGGDNRPMTSGQRESGSSQVGENIYFVLEKDDVLCG